MHFNFVCIKLRVVWSNFCRNHTLLFKYPGNGDKNAAIKFETFLNVVCFCIGADCYILFPTSRNGGFEKFTNAEGLNLIKKAIKMGAILT